MKRTSIIKLIILETTTPKKTMEICAVRFSSSIRFGIRPARYPIIEYEKLKAPKVGAEKTPSISPIKNPTVQPEYEPLYSPIKMIKKSPNTENLENRVSKKMIITTVTK